MVDVILMIENAADDMQVEDVVFASGSGIRRSFGSQIDRDARQSSLADVVLIAGQIASLATAATTIFELFKLLPKPNTSVTVTLKDPTSGLEMKIEGTSPEDVERKLEQARALMEKQARPQA